MKKDLMSCVRESCVRASDVLKNADLDSDLCVFQEVEIAFELQAPAIFTCFKKLLNK